MPGVCAVYTISCSFKTFSFCIETAEIYTILYNTHGAQI